MKQIGNLAVVCANRQDVLLQIQGQEAAIHVGTGPMRQSFYVAWDDDDAILGLIKEMNFGKYRIDSLEGEIE